MKNPILIVAIIVVVTALGVGAYALFQSSSPAGSMMKQDNSLITDEKTTINNMTGTRYVEYSKSIFDSAANNRRVLFFYASWCPTCKPADASFRQNESKIPEDITVVRVNYNDPETDKEEKDLAKKYGITYQHTFVQIDSTGREVTKWNGGQIDELLSNVK